MTATTLPESKAARTGTARTIRVACVADNQVDERSRLEEHDRVMRFVADDAKARSCSLMLHGGDVYERKSTVRERQSVRDWLAACYPMPVVIAGGNHEAPGEVVELASVNVDGWEPVFPYERPTIHRVDVSQREPIVAVLPWPRLGWLAAHEGENLSREELRTKARAALESILIGFREQLLAHPGPRILLAHWTPTGYRTDPDQPSAPIGDAMALSPQDLAVCGADVVVGGHIHMPQDWRAPHAFGDWMIPVIQCGSPRRTAFAKGELVTKGYVYMEFGERDSSGQIALSWERVKTPATPMVLIEAEYDAGLAVPFRCVDYDSLTSLQVIRGAEIRFRYTVDAADRANAKAAAEECRARWLHHGAATVKLEPVTRVAVEARAPEVARVTTTGDKLRALWSARGDSITDADAERVLGRLAELQSESEVA